MWTTRKFRRAFGGNVCRHCVNDVTHIHLYPKDCRYAPARGVCPRCKKPNKHIVSGFKFSGKWQLRGK